MPFFSDSEINEAKRRVREMQNKASSFVDENERHTAAPPPLEEKANTQSRENQDNADNTPQSDNDSSLFVILALIMLLSKEKADNSLILALLYLLL